ncbi:MAG: CRTAC1 family protein [Planctomycetaceae bacterium]|nr:CRTAC1 family protein [Planctomycetaceae bacterium]
MPDMSAGDDFEDITARSGIQHQYQSGRTAEQYTMIEGLGGGVALFDYDQDGDLDLLCASGGTISAVGEVQGLPCQLYQNEGDFQFTNVTEASGLNIPIDYQHGIAVADVDQDGYPDIFLSCYGRSRLFQNVAGKSFRDVTDQLGVELSGWHTASLFADFNQDGRPDLFVTGYLDWSMEDQPVCTDPVSGKRDVCLPSQFQSAPDRLLLNLGDFHFQDASQAYGIRNDGKGLGAISGDFDQDGRIDLYVANDVTSNFFYKGLETGGFQEMGVSAGLSGNEYGSAEGSMGVTAADINHDGRMDLFVTNFELEDNSVYLNEGNDLFVHSTARLGLAGACRLLVGFGCLFSDLNADGWEDLVLLNGHLVYRHRNSDYQQKAFVFRNNQGRFQDVTSESGPWFQIPHSGRGLAVGDLNNDGAVDLVITEQDGPTSLLKNRNVPRNWLGLELKRKAGISDLTGTLVTFSLQNQKQTKQVLSGGSYLSHSDQRILFYPPAGSEGLDSAGIEVTWPDGSSDQFENLMWNTYQVLQQGTGNRSN